MLRINSTIFIILSINYVINSGSVNGEMLPNIEYAAQGYDIFLGDPFANGEDPGWRGQVFNSEASKRHLTSDGSWVVPGILEVF